MNLKRFGFEHDDPLLFTENPEGEYVLWEKAITTLAQRDAEIARLRAELDAAKQKLAKRDRLVSACRMLLDAPHQEHFDVRLNEQEMHGLKAIKGALTAIERNTHAKA